jgi:hypothetical protein
VLVVVVRLLALLLPTWSQFYELLSAVIYG